MDDYQSVSLSPVAEIGRPRLRSENNS